MGQECKNCGGEEFHCKNGLYYCKGCQQHAEDYIETADFELNFDNCIATGIGGVPVAGRKLTQQTVQVQSQRESQRQLQTEETTFIEPTEQEKGSKGRPFTTFEVYQIILASQADALVKKGFPHVLKERVFKIWCKYLSELREAFTKEKNYNLKINKVQDRDASRVTQSHQKHLTGSGRKRKKVGSDGDNVDFQKPLTVGGTERVSSSAANKLNMNTLLGLLYLAIAITNPAYTIGDLRRWIQDGSILYFNADRYLPDDMHFMCKDHNLLTNLTMPAHSHIRRVVSNLARYLDFADSDFPAVDIQALCNRYITELNLPGELRGLVIFLVRSKPPYLRFLPNCQHPRRKGCPMYEGVAMSYIIIVLRSLFGFYSNLETVLTQYAEGVQQQLGDTASQLFNIQSWMYQRISNQLIDLPNDNLDTQRLACLKSALLHFSNISAPLSRHTERGAKSKTKLNTDTNRKQLLDITDELVTKIDETRLADEQEENDEGDLESVSAASEAPSTVFTKATTAPSTITEWSQPGATSTQRQDENQQSTHQSQAMPESFVSPMSSAKSFMDHSILYVMNHRKFCKRHKLISGYNGDTVQEHVEQYLDGDSAEKVCNALRSDSLYCTLSDEQTENNTPLKLLFQICADHISCSDEELLEVYAVIEEAYVCHQHSLTVPPTSSQRKYFLSDKEQNKQASFDLDQIAIG